MIQAFLWVIVVAAAPAAFAQPSDQTRFLSRSTQETPATPKQPEHVVGTNGSTQNHSVLPAGNESVSVVERHGRLWVKGNMTLDEAGNPVRLRGMSLFWSQWMGRFWNAQMVRWLQEDWGITVVRAAMAVEMGGFLSNPSQEEAKMAEVVEAAIEVGIYVIVDWHDHHAADHPERAKAFFSNMAQKYGSYPNVMFEPWNEPVKQDWNTVIKPYHGIIVSAIREHTSNIIILGTRLWSQEVDVASKNPVDGENIAYTIHFYANTHGEELRQKVREALGNGIAVFATEWGTCSADGNGVLDLEETQRWLDFFAENYISDANWAIDDKEEACAALLPGAGSFGGWTSDDLTQSGRWVRNSLIGI